MKKKTLQEHSKSYYKEADYYQEFSKYEDYPKKIEKFLLSKIKGKIVLDLGCGSGKYLNVLAPLSKKYYALDVSKQQLRLAKEKAKKITNIRFFNSSAENIPLLDETIDIIISTWVVSTVIDFRRKRKILEEINRVLKNNCKIYLVENDSKGEFEKMRGHIKRTREYNNWLIKKGFKKVKKVKTYFKFPSFQIAELIFYKIWGKKVSNQIKSNIIEHQIVIFEKNKEKTANLKSP
ncbi:hypothetical protein A3K73_02115 [Candidatus Pacearchaeota archaeon RBG_13_36_9]|nr:MAG: hypothetical protein A3K73_02115 [Candidatus Pacearchaeota archaeon RBG_13_36_9]